MKINANIFHVFCSAKKLFFQQKLKNKRNIKTVKNTDSYKKFP